MDAFLREHLDGGENAHRKRCALGVRWKCREMNDRLGREMAKREHLEACAVLRDALCAYAVVGVELPDADLLAEDVRRNEERMARKRVMEEDEVVVAKKTRKK